MEQSSFEDIKRELGQAPVLRAMDYSQIHERPPILTTDASGVGVGCVLSQEDADGNCYVIGYFSGLWNRAQRGYHVVKQELLGLVLSL